MECDGVRRINEATVPSRPFARRRANHISTKQLRKSYLPTKPQHPALCSPPSSLLSATRCQPSHSTPTRRTILPPSPFHPSHPDPQSHPYPSSTSPIYTRNASSRALIVDVKTRPEPKHSDSEKLKGTKARGACSVISTHFPSFPYHAINVWFSQHPYTSHVPLLFSVPPNGHSHLPFVSLIPITHVSLLLINQFYKYQNPSGIFPLHGSPLIRKDTIALSTS